jgi:hypothetical protein
MQSKTDKLLQMLRSGDDRGALRLAKTFRLGLTDDQRAAIKRAHECYENGHFYAQLGRDPGALRARGLEVLREVYGARL